MTFWKNIHQTLETYLAKDPAARSKWEIVLCYPGFHAQVGHQLTHWLWRHRQYLIARFLAHIFRMLTGIEIHPAAKIGQRLVIDHGMGIVIGETAEIGDDCLLFHQVTLGGTKSVNGKRHPTLGDRVTVGTGAKILGAVFVGDDAKIGANAVIIKNVPAGTVMVSPLAQPLSR